MVKHAIAIRAVYNIYEEAHVPFNAVLLTPLSNTVVESGNNMGSSCSFRLYFLVSVAKLFPNALVFLVFDGGNSDRDPIL